MRTRALKNTAWQRLQRPTTWGAVLGFGGLWVLTSWGVGNPVGRWQDLVFPFAVPFIYLALSPIPWQWTGDDRPLVTGPRGVLQALVWNLLWVGGLVLLLGMGQPPPGHGRPEPPAHQGVHPPPDQGPPPGPGILPDLSAPRTPPPGQGLRPDQPQPGDGSGLGRIFHPGLLAILLTNLSLAMLLGWILANLERAQEREAEAVQAATLAKARALQSQMSPHVLFNAISGLTELVWKDQKATEEALVNLAQLLRGLLDSSTRPVDPLSTERSIVEHYLAVERIRLGARLRIEWDWDELLESHLVPPLMLQPLVENAIKHGIAPCREGGELRISLRAEGSGFCLGVANTGVPFEAGRPEGIGLGNLRERLSLLGERPECLRLQGKEGWTVAELHLGRIPEEAS